MNGAVLPPLQLVSHGENATFICSVAQGVIESYQWEKDDIELGETSSVLHIVNITAADGGKYVCTVNNTVSSVSAYSMLHVRPQIIIQPLSTTTVSGSLVNITCVGEAFPPPTYQWHFTPDTMPNETVQLSLRNQSSLLFSPVLFGDEGYYQCVVVGTNGSAAYSQVITLTSKLPRAIYIAFYIATHNTVSPETSVKVSPSETQISPGSNITFLCTAMGGPGNSYMWLKEDQIIINETSHILVIEFVDAIIHGGTYTCVVSNTAGSGFANALLFVNPMIISEPSDASAENGSVVSFSFIVQAFPLPVYVWEYANGILEDNAVGRNTSTLVLNPVLFGNEGIYTCTAFSNNKTKTSEPTTLSGII